jgi:hypothetical protein
MVDRVTEAQKLFQEALDASRDQRRQIEQDERFSDPSNPDQWDEDIRLQRENDPGGRRPCLVVDQLGQYVANVAGQVEKQPPALHAIPVGGGADKRAAEQMDGRFRHIEYASRAQQHYQRVLQSAARLGVGYLIIRPEYTDQALNWQEPRISSEPDPLKVVFDPWSDQTDGSDADFAYLLSPVSQAEFKRRWPRKKPVSFGETEVSRPDTERDSIIVAEQWKMVDTTVNCIVCMGADGERVLTEDEFWAAREAGEVLVYVRDYRKKMREVRWCRMSGADVLDEPKGPDGKVMPYPADSIGVVPVYGYIGWRNGRLTYCGIPRRGRTPQQAYNYHVSEQLAYVGTAPRSPWLVPIAALVGQGVKEAWDNASVQSRAYLPYAHTDESGQPVPQPTRVNTGTNLVNHQAGAEQALRDIQASIGMYQASLGAPSNETSGIAIESRKQQGEASTAHFPSHLSASLGQVGKIVMQMDARLADTRRKAALIGIDGSAGSVVIDPEQTEAFQRGEDGAVIINPRVGEYGVRVVIGASYSTQRSNTNAAFAEIMRGNKEMAPVVAPFWAQTLDFPGSDKFAQALAAMAPPPVRAILQPEGQGEKQGPSQAELLQMVEQLKQAVQEATAIAQEAEQAETEALQEAAKLKLQLADKQASIEIDEYKAETERLKVTGANVEQIEGIVGDLINSMLQSPSPLPGDPPMQPMHEPTQPAMPDEPMPQEMAQPMPIEPEQPEPMQAPGPAMEQLP